MAEVHSYLEEEQDKMLQEARTTAKQQAFQMKRCLDNNKLMDALKHAANMISELRTSLLTPRNYYDLYMFVFAELENLESFLTEESAKGKRIANLYEVVQYAGNILPRLYLLVCVGSVYIKSKEAPAKDVLKDLVEMCRGVQHPMRGLFLRHYLSQMSKGKLPDIDTDGAGGTVKDSIQFVLQNFTEMNKLWVRMQHQGVSRDRERRERERMELRVLVGTNLVRLSNLEGLTESVYVEVLPRILEQIIKCGDTIAQQYLMDCIIQAFPDDFHLRTLHLLLKTCGRLEPDVNINAIVVSLVDRLANYAANNPDAIPADIRVFDIFSDYLAKLVEQRPTLTVKELIKMQQSLLTLSVRCYPTSLDFVDQVYAYTVGLLKKRQQLQVEASAVHIVDMMTHPLAGYKNMVAVLLRLEAYPFLLPFLPQEQKLQLAETLSENLIYHAAKLSDPEHVRVFVETYLRPLVQDGTDGEDQELEVFEERTTLFSKLIHLFVSPEPEQQFEIYKTLWQLLREPATGLRRLKVLVVPLVFGILALAMRMKRLQEEERPRAMSIKQVFELVYEIMHHKVPGSADFLTSQFPQVALRLLMNAAKAADACGFGAIAYAFALRAFLIFEEETSDTKMRFSAISQLIGTLQTMKSLGEDHYTALRSNLKAYAKHRLLKVGDKCRAMYLCSHLFWFAADEQLPYEGGSNGSQALDCLKSVLQTLKEFYSGDTIVCLRLYVEVLNQYLYYFENRNEVVTTEALSTLIRVISDEISRLSEKTEDAIQVETFFQNTVGHIRMRQRNTEDGARYQMIQI